MDRTGPSIRERRKGLEVNVEKDNYYTTMGAGRAQSKTGTCYFGKRSQTDGFDDGVRCQGTAVAIKRIKRGKISVGRVTEV